MTPTPEAPKDGTDDYYDASDAWLSTYFSGGMDLAPGDGARTAGRAVAGPPPTVPMPPEAPPRDGREDARGDEPAQDWRPFVVGTPVERFEPKPPATVSYRPDTVHDGWSTDRLTVRAASVRGYAHRHDGRPREDDVALGHHRATGTVVFAVADGVSQAGQSYIGATLACRAAVDDIAAQLDRGPKVDLGHTVRTAAYQLVARVAGAGRSATEQDSREAENRYATTLVTGTVAVDEHGVPQISLVQVGDSGAWLLHRGAGRFERLLTTKDSRGEEMISSAVTPLPRVPREVRTVRVPLLPDCVLLVGTDGFGDALGDGRGDVGRLFATALRTPPPARGLGHLLDFSRETFDDDRTLLAVWPRHLLPSDSTDKEARCRSTSTWRG